MVCVCGVCVSISVSVLTKLIVFKPTVGLLIQGKVNKISDNHLSILVFGMFNANIASNEMSKNHKYCSDLNSLQSPSGDIHEEDLIDFTCMKEENFKNISDFYWHKVGHKGNQIQRSLTRAVACFLPARQSILVIYHNLSSPSLDAPAAVTHAY